MAVVYSEILSPYMHANFFVFAKTLLAYAIRLNLITDKAHPTKTMCTIDSLNTDAYVQD